MQFTKKKKKKKKKYKQTNQPRPERVYWDGEMEIVTCQIREDLAINLSCCPIAIFLCLAGLDFQLQIIRILWNKTFQHVYDFDWLKVFVIMYLTLKKEKKKKNSSLRNPASFYWLPHLLGVGETFNPRARGVNLD